MSFRICALTNCGVLALTLALSVACGDDDADTSRGDSPDATANDDQSFPDAGGGDASDAGDEGNDDQQSVDASSTDGTMKEDAAMSGEPGDSRSDDLVDAGSGGSSLEIVGEFHDDFGDWIFTDTTWELRYEDASRYAIESYSNEQDYLIALADEDNLYDAGLYQKLMWIESGDSLYTCTATAGGVETSDEAREATADESDLESGCGGFPWSFVEPGLLSDE